MRKINKIGAVLMALALLLCVLVHAASAQGVNATDTPDQITVEKAVVTDIVKESTETIPGLNIPGIQQTLKAHVIDGADNGKDVTFDNDYIKLDKGEIFFMNHTVNRSDGTNRYSVADPYRLLALCFFIGIFVLCVIIFGGKQGIRGLLALVLSFVFIIYLLLPGVLHGFSPILVSIGVSVLIIVLGSYITHGFNKVTTSAVAGMIVTILITGVLAYTAIHFAHLSGFSTEESTYLNMDTGGTIDFAGLLLGAIMIGLLGVLYDAAIGQAVTVDEFSQIAPKLERKEIMKRALRIGREHVGALVNTLAIAYVGAALPLLLLFYSSGASVVLTLNKELFATEIIRMMIGSIGLVLAVPITTLVAVRILVKRF